MILGDYKSLPVIILLIISGIAPAYSQPSGLEAYVLSKHGADLNLANGILYYDRYKNVLNHPFYSGEESLPGTAVISGTLYHDVQINYDIYSQNLVLEYPVVSGGAHTIIISPDHTDGFDFDGNHFEKLTLDNHGPQFYQLIRVNGITCYIHWDKKKEKRSYQFQSYFTEPDRRCFLDYFGELSPYSNRRRFVSLISGFPKKEINRYLWKNGIRLSDATPEQMEDLLHFISSGIKPTTGN